MARALTVARVRVAPQDAPRWLDAMAALRATEQEAGRHVWVFRHPQDRDLYLAFREGPAGTLAQDAAAHHRLQGLGQDEGGGDIVWEEVELR